MVITTAMPDSTMICWVSGESATIPKVMAMISAERMKSVRTAPLILAFSKATRSTLASATASLRASCCASSSSLLCKNLCASFSKPSKHRNAPPNINNGVTAHGMNALISSAAGTRIALLTNEPLATAQTTGSSRSARTPVTC
ncbi:hypothetical protein D3C78_1426990 [compost metagenome]